VVRWVSAVCIIN